MKTPRPNILIFTTRTGGGHMNLAQSLEEILSVKYNVSIVDPYPDILHHYYAALSRHFLRLWDMQYTYTDNKVGALLLHYYLTFSIRKRVAALLEQIKPELIISTHSLLSYEIAWVNERRAKKIPLVFQLTDLEQTHVSWFTEKRADAYLSPTHEIYVQASRQGIDADRLHVTGRPVRSQFLRPPTSTRADTLTSLGLSPTAFTIFLQGGAKGSAGIDRTVEGILTTEFPIQIILAAGNNTALAAHFTSIERLKVLPFTETIAPYMAASDLIVGKAGASFLSEAFMLEKPCLVTAFIPGQEAPNLRFLERHNLGWVCLDAGAQKRLITTVVSHPTMMTEKVASIRAYKAWNTQANHIIFPLIEELLVK